MKILRSYTWVLGCLLCFACKKKESAVEAFSPSSGPATLITGTVSSYMVLKIDFLSYELESAKEMKLSSRALLKDSIPFIVHYVPASDFGSVEVRFKPNNDSLFYGGIIWMGTGQMFFPRRLDSANTFEKNSTLMFNRNDSRFQKILITQWLDEANMPDYGKLWSAISSIKAFEPYYNLHYKIAFFLYTPSIGLFDPTKADWIVYLFR